MERVDAYHIHRLTLGDAARLSELMSVFGEAFDQRDVYTARAPDQAYLTRLLSKDHFLALVSMTGTSVIGGLTAYLLEKPEQRRSEIYIYDLAIAEPYRRRGIATQLLEELRRIAATLDAYVMFVQADHADIPALGLYHKLGHHESVHHFDIHVLKPNDTGTQRL